MELLYNPDRMPEEEIKATFVARHALLDEIIAIIQRQPDGAGVQHLVIIAPRGMGKTTMLLMIRLAIKEREFANHWQAVKFTEESPSINDLADFWIEVLKLVAADTTDNALNRRIEAIEAKYRNNEDLQEAALALIKDWRREHKKRLILLVENFDQILEQINDERDNARLRDVLMNDGTLMLIGGATSFFKETRAYDQPLYNFFKIYNLEDLRFEEMKQLLLKRAEVDNKKDFEEVLKKNLAGLRTLEYFTGGNPRLLLMLYRVVQSSNLQEVRRALEKLLDEVTPYFKHKIDILPAQQKKILDHIARVSGITREGVTPGAIAEATRLPPNQVSSQLKRLADLGYVRTANLRRRASYYTLSEPLYAIWHQMRFGRESRERMGWLINFLKVFYAGEQGSKQSGFLESNFQTYLKDGRLQEARDTLELHQYLFEAMEDPALRARAQERVMRGYLEIKDTETVKNDLLSAVTLEELSEEILDRLAETGCIDEEQVIRAKVRKESKGVSEAERRYVEEIALALLAYRTNKFEDSLAYLNRAIEIKPDNDNAWNTRGMVLGNLGCYEEAVASYDRALGIRPDNADVWYNRGIALRKVGRYEEAVASYDRALEIDPDRSQVWNNRGILLRQIGRFDEAITSFDRAFEITPDTDEAWYYRGVAKLASFINFVRNNNDDAALNEWHQALISLKQTHDRGFQALVSEVLLVLALEGNIEFVRQLIAISNLEEEVFPLARAIDYLQSNNETEKEELIEKLSPEVRGIVEEVVARLQPVVKKSSRLKTSPSTNKRGRKKS